MERKLLLFCGILSSLLYAGMMTLIPMLYPGYSASGQTVSELFAIGAPTRPLWVVLSIPYATLLAAFGIGLWQSAGADRSLRMVAILMLVHALFAASWPPIHQRGAGYTLSDTLHNVWASVTLLLLLLAMWFAADSLGQRFRAYTWATLAVLAVFAVVTAVQSPGVAANLPTPWIGIWERIAIASFLLWVAVLAIARMPVHVPRRSGPVGHWPNCSR